MEENRKREKREGGPLSCVLAIACYSPYGTQIFLTCVAARRNSRPSLSSRSSQSRSCHVAQVRFMFDADASSTAFTPSRPPKYHIASTSSCSASTLEIGRAHV